MPGLTAPQTKFTKFIEALQMGRKLRTARVKIEISVCSRTLDTYH